MAVQANVGARTDSTPGPCAALRHEFAPAGIEILQSWLKSNWPNQSVVMSKNGETDDVKREKRASTLLAAE